jgi:hypothetical protein
MRNSMSVSHDSNVSRGSGSTPRKSFVVRLADEKSSSTDGKRTPRVGGVSPRMADAVLQQHTAHTEGTRRATMNAAPRRTPPPPDSCKKQEMYVYLSDIIYYQDYIANSFHSGISFQKTVDQLRNGDITPETIEKMDVLYWRGNWYGMGNRRLTCFNIVFGQDKSKQIPCIVTRIPDSETMNPQGSGLSVRIGGCGVLIDGRWVSTFQKPV